MLMESRQGHAMAFRRFSPVMPLSPVHGVAQSFWNPSGVALVGRVSGRKKMEMRGFPCLLFMPLKVLVFVSILEEEKFSGSSDLS